METNRQKMSRLGMCDDIETVKYITGGALCDLCEEKILAQKQAKNLNTQVSPCNNSNKWCEKAVELWLDEDAE